MRGLVCMLLLLWAVLLGANVDDREAEDRKVNPWVEMFGEKLYAWTADRQDVEEVSTVEKLANKNVVAIYFSASWCGPCKQFTPQLAQFYAAMNKKGKKFEVVWVSGDRSSEEFAAYYAKMPWPAVPLPVAQKVHAKLGPKYQLKGIPHLVILDGEDASVYTLDGRSRVSQDSYGLEFPWRPRTLMNLLPKSVSRLLLRQLARTRAAALQMLRGALESLAPKKVLAFVQAKVQALLATPATAAVGGAGGGGPKAVKRRPAAAVAL